MYSLNVFILLINNYQKHKTVCTELYIFIYHHGPTNLFLPCNWCHDQCSYQRQQSSHSWVFSPYCLYNHPLVCFAVPVHFILELWLCVPSSSARTSASFIRTILGLVRHHRLGFCFWLSTVLGHTISCRGYPCNWAFQWLSIDLKIKSHFLQTIFQGCCDLLSSLSFKLSLCSTHWTSSFYVTLHLSLLKTLPHPVRHA